METEAHEPTSSRPTRTWGQRVRRAFVLYVVLPYLVVVLIFTAVQRKLMYQPTVADNLSIANVGLEPEFGIDVELTTADGNTIRGWLINGRDHDQQGNDNGPLVIYFPGNSFNRHERIHDLREVAARGFDVLAFDYRGYGDSTGSPTESALSADALLVWQYARDTLGYDERQIVVFAESIGGGVALSMWSETNANQPQPACVILSSTFTSMPNVVGSLFPMLPFQFLLFDRWPSIDRISHVQAPVIIFHGTDDLMIPIAHGRALAKASSHARLIEIPGGGHNEIPTPLFRKELVSLIESFRPTTRP